MKLELAVSGGFTGPAGTQKVSVDLNELAPADAARLRQELDSLPDSSWGTTFLDPHPKPWQFRHSLRVVDGDRERSTVFHLDHGPAALSTIARRLLHQPA